MLVDQALFVLAVCSLGGAALRVATTVAGDSAIDRVLVAAPVAATFAVCWTLALGLAGLAGSALALTAGGVLAWVLSRMVKARRSSLLSTAAESWPRFSRAQRTLALALLGAAAGLALEIAIEPGFDVDALAYHLADVVGWLHTGHAGSVQTFSYDYPVGYYPVTGEVLLTWGLGISRTLAPLAGWPVAILALALLAMWRLLDLLRVPRPAAVAALCAFATLPLVAVSLNLVAPGTDLPAVAWLACAAALSVRSAARPALLGPALLAAGLGAGTKTTVVPLALVALAAGAWSARSGLRSARPWLLSGAVGGLLVAAPWYVRNTIVHGWPLWPFSSGPTGDPLPHVMSLFHDSFLDRPGASVRMLGSFYLQLIAGGLGLAAGILVIPFITRSRMALIAGVAAAGSLLIWATAPFTGLARLPQLAVLALSTVRYLLAPLGACAVALALAARDASPVWRRLLIAGLLACAAGSLVADLTLGYPRVPRLQYPLVGAIAGALAGALLSLPRGASSFAPAARVGLAVAAIVSLSLSARGWLWRESTDGSYQQSVLAFMMSKPSFRSGSQPIAFAPDVLATLAGPRLRHPIELIPAQEPCERVRARIARGWVVIWPGEFVPGISTPFDAYSCLARQHPIYSAGGALIYGPD